MTEIDMPHVEDFLQHMKVYQDASEYTLINYPLHLKKFFNYTKGRFEVNIRTVNNFTEYLLTERKFSRATVNAVLSAVRSYYNFLYNEEIIDNNLGSKIKFVKKDPTEVKKIMPQKEIIKILDSVTNVKERAILETLYATGIREGECSDLNIEHVDFENQLVAIIKGKGKKSRVIPISKTALKWIKANMGSRKSGPLFLNNKGDRMGERGIYNICKKYFPFSPHTLRHAYATHMITKTGNMKAVSEMLGHSTITMTEKIYTHMTSDYLKEVYKDSGMDRE